MGADVAEQLVVQLRRVHASRVDRGAAATHPRRVEAADHHAIYFFRRKGARNGNGDHVAARIAEQAPESGTVAVSAVDKLKVVRAGSEPKEIKDAVLAWVLAGHEACPGRECPRRNGGAKRS